MREFCKLKISCIALQLEIVSMEDLQVVSIGPLPSFIISVVCGRKVRVAQSKSARLDTLFNSSCDPGATFLNVSARPFPGLLR